MIPHRQNDAPTPLPAQAELEAHPQWVCWHERLHSPIRRNNQARAQYKQRYCPCKTQRQRQRCVYILPGSGQSRMLPHLPCLSVVHIPPGKPGRPSDIPWSRPTSLGRAGTLSVYSARGCSVFHWGGRGSARLVLTYHFSRFPLRSFSECKVQKDLSVSIAQTALAQTAIKVRRWV